MAGPDGRPDPCLDRRELVSYGQEKAVVYEDDREHLLPPEEAAVWLDALRSLAPIDHASAELLDVGAGTGLLTAVMKKAGFRAVGLEPSPPMVQEGLRRHVDLVRGDFVVGWADQVGLFEPGRFAWIVSRQMLCHLSAPERTFAAWHRWLAPGGHAVLVDGCWSRSAWSEEDLSTRPFASVVDATSVADALVRVGFTVLEAGPFDALNEARSKVWPGSAQRYRVVARKG